MLIENKRGDGGMGNKNERKIDALAMATKIMERFTGVEGQEAKSGRLRGIDFKTLEGFESPEVLQELGIGRKGWIPLHKMPEMLTEISKFHFFRTAFENRDRIPKNELRNVWYAFLNETTNWSLCRETIVDPEWSSIASNPLLVDNYYMRCWYVQMKQPGWNFLHCMDKRRTANIKISSELQSALDEDNVPLFEMRRNLEGRRMCFSLLMRIINGGKWSIVKHLVANDGIPKDVMTVEELCCYCMAWFNEELGWPLLEAIEEARPGFLKNVHDFLGRNLLWYAVFNDNIAWFQKDCILTSFLLEAGCDPDNQNQLGLSWREVTSDLTPEQIFEFRRARLCKGLSYLFRPKK